jgi:plastocyanin
MDRRWRDMTKRTFCTSRSRRQVLATAAKGALGGAGVAMLGGGLSPSLLGSDFAPSARAQAVMVSIFDSGFDPATIEVPVGTEITWTNNGQPVPEGQVNNTVTSVNCGNTFNSGQIDPGATFSHTFATAGAFPYQNAANPFAMGMVTVTAAPKTYVRPNLHSLEPDGPELQAYARAVSKMKDRDLTDPTSWLYQAYIHGMPEDAQIQLITDLGITTLAQFAAALGERGWITCEHHTLFFWPWHRMYLYWFERIVRELGEYPDFALPYWDYLDADQRVLPAPFRDSANPLFVELRDPALNSGGIPDLSAEEENAIFGNLCAGFGQKNFPGASDQLETTPHDFVHTWAGGFYAKPAMPLAGLMSNIATSAQDPLFWLHHANLDRMWTSWQALGGADPTSTTWLENDVNSGLFADADPPIPPLPYTFFNETGTEVTEVRVVKQVLDTFALGYTYDDLFTPIVRLCKPCEITPAGPEAAAFATPAATPQAAVELGRTEPAQRIAIGSNPVAIPVPLHPPEEAVGVVERGEEVVLTLGDVRGEGVPGTLFEVYINLPEGQEPDFRSPYFVGNIGLFGLQPQDQEMGPLHIRHTATRRFNISRNIASLQQRGEWTGDVTVTIVPYYAGRRAPVEAAGATPEAGAATPMAGAPSGPWITFDSVAIDAQ